MSNIFIFDNAMNVLDRATKLYVEFLNASATPESNYRPNFCYAELPFLSAHAKILESILTGCERGGKDYFTLENVICWRDTVISVIDTEGDASDPEVVEFRNSNVECFKKLESLSVR